jgi:hypothetical protein
VMASGRAGRRDFGEFVAARSSELLRLAHVLTGDRHADEDLPQSALAKARAALGADPRRAPGVTCGASCTATRSTGGGAVRGGARGHRTTVISLDSALCLPLRVVLVEGRDEGKPGGLHDIRGRRPDRNPAARQLHLELDLSDRLAARAD